MNNTTMMTNEFGVIPISPEYTTRISSLMTELWGADFVVSKRRTHYPHKLPGFLALAEDDSLVGVATYQIDGDECELVTLDSLAEGQGVGSALIAAVREVAQSAGCRRLWLITTNDNLNALGFYQKRGFELVAVHRNAMEFTRTLKPRIPLIGANGVPLRDEIELEMRLT